MEFKIDDLIHRLREDVLDRRIDSNTNWLQVHKLLLSSKDADQPTAAVFAGYLSQWFDIVSGDPEAVKEWIEKIRQSTVSSLRLCEYLHIRLAAGTVAFGEERIQEAAQHFDFIIGLSDEMITAKELIAFGHLWKARCEQAFGAFASALNHAQKARDLMSKLGHPRTATALEVFESRLYLEQDKLAEGLAVLVKTEAAMTQANDPYMAAEICSAYGRIALRQGGYEQAVKQFSSATELYRKLSPRHNSLAGSLVSTARAKRLLALRLARRIDAEVDARRKLHSRDSTALPNASTELRRSFEQLQAEAFTALTEAEDIFESHRERLGMGEVRLSRSALFLDDGDLENAELEAAEAYRFGVEKNNFHLMGNGLLEQSSIESAKYDEGLVGKEDSLVHLQRAYDFTREALALAERDKHPRLLARACISQGLLLCNDFFNNIETAHSLCDRAAPYFTPDHRDYVWEDYQILRAKVQRGSLALHLRNSSQGSIDGKSLQQMTAEFEDAIIPRVWELEERKISRAAARLSISPKKVRRVLSRLRLEGSRPKRSECAPGAQFRASRRVSVLH